jgi:hypothetical protein
VDSLSLVGENAFDRSGEEHLFFSGYRIQEPSFLSRLVFMQSRVTKMHTSFLLNIFSSAILPVIFRGHLRPEFAPVLRCFFSVELMLPPMTRRLGVELLETGFGFSYRYSPIRSCLGNPPGVIEKVMNRHDVQFYRTGQLRNSLTIFISLIVIVLPALHSICLNCPGIAPGRLEDAFGKGETRC